MAQFLNFKAMEVTGATKEEALAKAPFDIMGDATAAFKKWKEKQTNGITENEKRQFMQDQLAKKTKYVRGAGLAITIESAVSNTRERPYKITDVKNEKGTRKYQTVIQIRDKETNAIIAEIEGTKAKAKQFVKDLYAKKGYKNEVVAVYDRKVKEGEPIAFTAKYEASKSTRVGTYLVFGIERG